MMGFGDRATCLPLRDESLTCQIHVCILPECGASFRLLGKRKAERAAVDMYELMVKTFYCAVAAQLYDQVTAAAYFTSPGVKMFYFVGSQFVDTGDECALEYKHYLPFRFHR